MSYHQQKWEEAFNFIEEFLDEEKYNVEAIAFMGNCLYRQEKFEEAEKLYLKAIRRGCVDTEIFKRIGLIYIKDKRWKEANAIFHNLCYGKEKKSGLNWRLLGLSYFKTRQIDHAEKALGVSNILGGNSWGLLSVISMIIGIGQNRGFQCYQNALRLGLDDPEIFSEIADLFSKTLNLIEESIYCFDKSLEYNPDQEDLWIQYAEYMLKQKDTSKAIDCYKDAAKWIKGDVKKEETLTKIKDLEIQLEEEKAEADKCLDLGQ